MYHWNLINSPYYLGEDDPPPVHTPHGPGGGGPIHTPHGPGGSVPSPIRTPPGYFPFLYRYPYYQWQNSEYEKQQLSRRKKIKNKSIIRNLEKAINGEYSAIICYQLLAQQSNDDTDKKE